MKEKVNPNHRMGKSTGYELINGEYHIAPMYTDWFATINDRRVSTDAFMQSVVKHVTAINKDIACEQRKLWDSLFEDLELDRTKRWTFDLRIGAIVESKQEKEA